VPNASQHLLDSQIAAQTAGVLDAPGERPGGDQPVAHVVVDLGAVLEDRLVDVEESGGDEGVRPLVTQALRQRGRAPDVDQQKHALLAHRPMVAPSSRALRVRPPIARRICRNSEIARKITKHRTVSRSSGRSK
jgi:hypothetical protein